MRVRTRVAPSPTGIVHVGTGYMSLFNWAYAKKFGGEFILRVEDTDVKRHVPGAEGVIYQGINWLGLSWDEGPDKGGKFGPYKQSDRLKIYSKKANELLNKGLAYEDEGAIRFKNTGEDIVFEDLVRGRITFPGNEITDFVIVRSDGMPLYNFCVVVDDILMEITHVIRGEEHLSNTPRQLALYKAFGVEPPKLAHLPLLRNEDRSKISKRKNPVSLLWYKEEGYLPEVLLNFFALLGWSHPKGKDIFDLAEFVKLFDFNSVHTTGPIFDLKKLDWINGEYIRETQNSKLKTQICEFYKGRYSADLIEKIIPLVKDRIKTLKELETLAGFFFERPNVDKKLLGKNYKKHLAQAQEVIEAMEQWSSKAINERLSSAVENNNFKTGDFYMDLRVAVTGSKFTPPINESIVILGKEESLARIKNLL